MKVFLGGTCGKTDWRKHLIRIIKCEYFNPVVEDWDENARLNENTEKEEICDVHLYVITNQIQGVYSIAEAVESTFNKDKTTVFTVLNYNKISWKKGLLHSLLATGGMIERLGGVFIDSNTIQ